MNASPPATTEKAAVLFSCGRCFLSVAGIVVAVEGDPCRDGSLPDALCDPIPEDEIAHATIGNEPAGNFPPELIRFFRGARWNEAMLRYAAAVINQS